MGKLEETKIITILNSGNKTITKAIKTKRLPQDIELELINFRYDLLTLLNQLQNNPPNKNTPTNTKTTTT